MLDIKQVSDKLAVSRNTIITLIKQGKLKALRVGSQYRIPEESFENFTKASAVVEQPSVREGVEATEMYKKSK